MRYAPYYCEENIWHLCQDGAVPGDERHAVFISSAARATPFRRQRAAAGAEHVVWDYHVILLVRAVDGFEVWDLDTTLGMPIALDAYLRETFRGPRLPPEQEPRFRVVPAADFVREFSSDRSHMRDADGNWQAPPPPWPPIVDAASSMNLPAFIEMQRSFMGEVFDLEGLRARFVG